MCYMNIVFGCKWDNMNHTCLLKGLLLREHFLKYMFKIFQKKIQINFLKYIFKSSLFISFFNAKKHALENLMNVFESFYSLNIFKINSHVAMVYYEPYHIKKSYDFNTKLNYCF